jgi:rare lipoprotein A
MVLDTMHSFRFVVTLGLAMCVFVLSLGLAHGAFGAQGLPLVAAAKENTGRTAKKPGAKQTSKAQAPAKAGNKHKAHAAQAPVKTGKKLKAPAAQAPVKTGKKLKTPAAKQAKRAPLPLPAVELPQSGIASWVGKTFQGKIVASGERHVMDSLTAAHRSVPFNSILKVTAVSSGRSVLVRVNDRGPFIRGRVIDVAKGAAEYLGFAHKGLTTVRVEFAGDAGDPSLSYYIRMRPAAGAVQASLFPGLGPFDKFDEAASQFLAVYRSFPDAELLLVRKKS